MRYLISLILLFEFVNNAKSQITSNEGTLITTPYHFSVTIPKEWNLLSKQEIEELKKTSGNTNLVMPALGYIGDKKHLDDIPHVYVIFYSQPKIVENGFLKSAKLILSNYVQNGVEKEMNKKFPQWSFKMNSNEYYIDTANKLVIFNSSTKYNDKETTVVYYCYFLMKTGAVEIIFSFDKSVAVNYVDVMKKVLSTVKIDSEYILVKD